MSTDPTAAPDPAADPGQVSKDGTGGGKDPSNTPVADLVVDLDPDDDAVQQLQAAQALQAAPDAAA